MFSIWYFSFHRNTFVSRLFLTLQTQVQDDALVDEAEADAGQQTHKPTRLDKPPVIYSLSMCLTLEKIMNSWAYIYFNPAEQPPRSHWWYPTYCHLRALTINTELGCSFWTGMVNRLDFNYQKLVLPGFLNHQPSRVFKSKVSFWVDENSSDGLESTKLSQYNKLGTSQEYPVNHKVFWFSLKGHFFHFSILQG